MKFSEKHAIIVFYTLKKSRCFVCYTLFFKNVFLVSWNLANFSLQKSTYLYKYRYPMHLNEIFRNACNDLICRCEVFPKRINLNDKNGSPGIVCRLPIVVYCRELIFELEYLCKYEDTNRKYFDFSLWSLWCFIEYQICFICDILKIFSRPLSQVLTSQKMGFTGLSL